MNLQDMYYSVVYHWDDIYCAYRDGDVIRASVSAICLKSGRIIYFDANDCVYCEFAQDVFQTPCLKCPIGKATGKIGCHGSPWHAFYYTPSAINALRMREFVRCHPPEGVEILHWLPN